MMNLKQILLEGKTYQVGILSMVVSIIFLSFHYKTIGYTTHDDFGMFSWGLANNWWDIAFANALGQGRVQYIYAFYLAVIPRIIPDFWYYRLFQVLPFIITVGLFAWVIYKVTSNRLFAVFTAVFFFSMVQNNWNHSLLTSYPLVYNFCISLLLVSIISLLKYFSNDKKRYLILMPYYFFRV